MAFMKNIIDLRGILTLMVLILPSIAVNIDCNGKPFHCVNTSHFMICVDHGSGVSSTIDDFVIPCPPTTVCQGTNRFECEFPAVITTVAPSVAPLVTSVSETLETVTTPIYEVIASIPFEEYYNTLSTTTLSEDVLITHQTIATEPTVTESTMQRVTDVIQNIEVIKSGYESNLTFSDTILSADVFQNDFTTLTPLPNNTSANVTEPIPVTTENVNVTIPGFETTLVLSEFISSVKVVQKDLTTLTSVLNNASASAKDLIPNATENIVVIIPESETITSLTDNAQIESNSALPIIVDITTASILTEVTKTTVSESALRDTIQSVDIAQNELTTLTPLPDNIRDIATDLYLDATESSNVLIPDIKMNSILTDNISSTTDVAQNGPTLLSTSNSSTLIVNIADTITETILTKITDTTPSLPTLKETISTIDLVQNDGTDFFPNTIITTDFIPNSTESVNIVIPESETNLTLSKTTPNLDVQNYLATPLTDNVVANDTYLTPDVTEIVNKTMSEYKTNSTLSLDTLGTPLSINIADTVTESILLEATETTPGASIDLVKNYLTTLNTLSNTALPDKIVNIVTEESVTDVTEDILKEESNLTLRRSTPIMPVEYVIQDHHTTLEIHNIIGLPSNINTKPTVPDKTANINIATTESMYKPSDETIPTESADNVKFYATTSESSKASPSNTEFAITAQSIITYVHENKKIVETESNLTSRRNLTSGSDNIVRNDIPPLYTQSKIALPNTSEPVSNNVLDEINKANTTDHQDSIVPDRNRSIKVILTPTETVTASNNIIVETTPNSNLETTFSTQNVILITVGKDTENIGNHQEMLTNQTDKKPDFNEKVLSTGTINTATAATPVVVKNETLFTSSLESSTDTPVIPSSTEATFTPTDTYSMNNESTILRMNQESNLQGDTTLASDTKNNVLSVTTLEHNGTKKSFQIVNVTASELLVPKHSLSTESSNYLPLPHLSANTDYIEEIPSLTDYNMQQSTNSIFDSSNVPRTDITVINEFVVMDHTTTATNFTVTETSKFTLSETLPTALSFEKDALNSAVNIINAEQNTTTSSLNNSLILTPAEAVTESNNNIVETILNSNLEGTILAQNFISITVGKDIEHIEDHQEMSTNETDRKPVVNEKGLSTGTMDTDTAATPVVVKNENLFTSSLVSSTDALVTPLSTEVTFTPTDTLAMNNESTILTNQESNIQGDTTKAGKTNDNVLPLTTLEHNGTKKIFQIVNVTASELLVPKQTLTTESSNNLPLPHLSANADYIERIPSLIDYNMQQSTNLLIDSSNVPSIDITGINEFIATDQTTMATTFTVTETSKVTSETLTTALYSEKNDLNRAVNNRNAEQNTTTSNLNNNLILTPAKAVPVSNNIIVETTQNSNLEGTILAQNFISITVGKDIEQLGNHQEMPTNQTDRKPVFNEKVLSTGTMDTDTAATPVIVKNENLFTSSLVSSTDAPVTNPSTEVTFTPTDTLAMNNESTVLTMNQESNIQGDTTLAGEINDNVLPLTTLEQNGTKKTFQIVNVTASELLVPKQAHTTESSNYLPLLHLSTSADYIEERPSLTDYNMQQSTNSLIDSSNVPSIDITGNNEFIAADQTPVVTTFTVTETSKVTSETLPTALYSEKDDLNRAVNNRNAEHNKTTSSLNNNLILTPAEAVPVSSNIIVETTQNSNLEGTISAQNFISITVGKDTEHNGNHQEILSYQTDMKPVFNERVLPTGIMNTDTAATPDVVKNENLFTSSLVSSTEPPVTLPSMEVTFTLTDTLAMNNESTILTMNQESNIQGDTTLAGETNDNVLPLTTLEQNGTKKTFQIVNVTASELLVPKQAHTIESSNYLPLLHLSTSADYIEERPTDYNMQQSINPLVDLSSVPSIDITGINEFIATDQTTMATTFTVTETSKVTSETLPTALYSEKDDLNRANENRAVNNKNAEYDTTTSSLNNDVTINDEPKLLTINSQTMNTDNFVPVYLITEVENNSYTEPLKNIESVKSKLDNIPDLSTMSSLLVDNVQSEIPSVTDMIPDITTSPSIVGLNMNAPSIKNKAKEETSNPIIIAPELIKSSFKTELPVQNAATTKTVTKIPAIFTKTLINNILGSGNSVTSVTESTTVNEADFRVRTVDANVLLRSDDRTVSIGAEAKKENNLLINFLLNHPIEQITNREPTVTTKGISLDSTSIQKNNTSTNKISLGDSSTSINDNMFSVGLAQQEMYTESISHTDTNLQKPLSNNNFTQEAVRAIDIRDQGTETSLPAIILDTQKGITHITSPNHTHTLDITDNSEPPQKVLIANYKENISETNQITVQEQYLMNNLETKPTQNIFITKSLPIGTIDLNEVKVTNTLNTGNIENEAPVTEENVLVPKQTKNTETNTSILDQPIKVNKPSKNTITVETQMSQGISTESQTEITKPPPVTFVRDDATPKQNIDSSDASTTVPITEPWKTTVVTKPYVQSTSQLFTQQPMIKITPTEPRDKIQSINDITKQTVSRPTVGHVASIIEFQAQYVTNPRIIDENPGIGVKSTNGPITETWSKVQGASEITVQTVSKPNLVKVANPRVELINISKNNVVSQTTEQLSILKMNSINIPKDVVTQSTRQVATPNSLNTNRDAGIVIVDLVKTNVPVLVQNSLLTDTHSGMSVLQKPPKKSKNEQYEKPEWSESVEEPEVEKEQDSEAPESSEGGPTNVATVNRETILVKSKGTKTSIGQANEQSVNENIDLTNNPKTLDSGLPLNTNKMSLRRTIEMTTKKMDENPNSGYQSIINIAESKVALASSDRKDKSTKNERTITTTIVSNVTKNNTARYSPKKKSRFTNTHNASVPAFESTMNSFVCKQNSRGRFSDSKDCRKFYICIGKPEPIEGFCPNNTVFSELRKQCTKNLSHCVRNNQFQCISEGRFSDYLNDNIYYICVKNNAGTFIRFKLQCQSGYHLNKTSVRCALNIKESQSTSQQSRSDISKNNSDQSVSSAKSEKLVVESIKEFECEKEGRFPDANDCRKYYICTKRRNKSQYRRKTKKCDNDELFHKDKKKCVDVDSYECS